MRVGTSGWQYDGWRGDYYPAGLAAARRLPFLAARLDSVELNGTFYSLQLPSSFARWHEETPAGFTFAVKGSRYITHLRRLHDVELPLATFFASGVLGLAGKLGPFLWQLPASMPFDAGLLRDFLTLLPATSAQAARLGERASLPPERSDHERHGERSLRHAVEARHPSFADDRFPDLLREHGVACVVSDSPRWPLIDVATSPLAYVRLHGHTELYASGYASRSLDRWAERCRELAAAGHDVVVYFDNDSRGRAPHDAEALAARVADLRPRTVRARGRPR